MWGKHDINKVWLRRLSLHEIVRLREIARTDCQLCAIPSSMTSQIKFFRYQRFSFEQDPASKIWGLVIVSGIQLGHFTATVLVARKA